MSRVIYRDAFEKLAAGLLPPLNPFTNQATLPAHQQPGTTMSMWPAGGVISRRSRRPITSPP